jgi:hypothetical protein
VNASRTGADSCARRRSSPDAFTSA